MREHLNSFVSIIVTKQDILIQQS